MATSSEPLATSETASPQNLDWKERLLKQTSQVKIDERIRDGDRIEDYAAEMKRFRKRTLDLTLGPNEETEEVGDTRTTMIDSPQTQTHYHYPSPAKSGGLGKSLLGAGLVAAIAGGLPIAALWGAGVLDNAKPPGPVVIQPAEPEPTKPIAGRNKVYDYRVGEPIIK